MYVEIGEPLRTELVTYAQELVNPRFLKEMSYSPHIPILDGIDANVDEVAASLGTFHPIRIMWGMTSIYTADDDHDYDVVKLDVFGLYLKRLRMRLKNKLNVAPTYQNYYPHLELAKVDALTALQYVGDNPFWGKKYVADKLVFISPDGKYYISGDGRVLKYD